MCHRCAAFSVLLNFISCFITWYPSLFLYLYSLCLSLYFVSLNVWVGCVSISNLSVYCVGKGLKRQLVNSWYWMEWLGRMLCVCGRVQCWRNDIFQIIPCLLDMFYSHCWWFKGLYKIHGKYWTTLLKMEQGEQVIQLTSWQILIQLSKKWI